MNKKIIFVCMVLFIAIIPKTANAMHIMEGFLPPIWCIIWGLLSLPFLIIGGKKITNLIAKNGQSIILLAMAGAFTFVLSALKIPSVTGSSSHMTGLGFSAIMFGPFVSSILGVIVLLFQALLLAHGGLTTLGANTFSMGIAGPIIAFFVYAGLNKIKCPKRVNIFFAAALGDLATYIITSMQLAIAYPSKVGGAMASFTKFAGIFAITQIPLAIIEGILTVVLINVIFAYGKNIVSSLGKDLVVYE